jgi:hypothetical protein
MEPEFWRRVLDAAVGKRKQAKTEIRKSFWLDVALNAQKEEKERQESKAYYDSTKQRKPLREHSDRAEEMEGDFEDFGND